jgi:hypothetical protein
MNGRTRNEGARKSTGTTPVSAHPAHGTRTTRSSPLPIESAQPPLKRARCNTELQDR